MSDTRQYESAFSLFSKSKDAVLRNKESFLVIVILPWLLQYIGGVITSGTFMSTPFGAPSAPDTTSGNPAGGILSLASFVLAVLFFPAYSKLAVEAAKGNVTKPQEIITSSFKYFWRLVGLGILVGFLFVVGLLLFIVPGLIVIRRYFLAAYYLVDQDLSISESMKKSAAATKSHAMAVWGVLGVSFLIALTSIAPLLGAVISTILSTLYACAPAFRYLELGGTSPENISSAAPVAPAYAAPAAPYTVNSAAPAIVQPSPEATPPALPSDQTPATTANDETVGTPQTPQI